MIASHSGPPPSIHPSAFVSVDARIGVGTKIWHLTQVREGVTIGEECIIGKGVYIGSRVKVGNRVKIQNGASLFEGVTLEDGVFVGPHVCFTNDRFPRATNFNGSLKTSDDWELVPTLIREGASIGASSVILPGVVVGRWAMAGAGSVITREVPDHGMVLGNPARLIGHACVCGRSLRTPFGTEIACSHCGTVYDYSGDGRLSPQSR